MLLGIDLGTSGVKAGLFERNGRLAGLGRGTGYHPESPHPGWAECDAARWWPAIVEAVRAAREDAASRRPRVKIPVEGIGLSTFFPAIVPMAKDGRPLRPALLYSDQRSAAQARAIEMLIPRPRYEGLIGNRLACGNTGVTSIHWVRDHEPGLYAAAATIGFANTLLTRRLTGELVTDWSTASLSGLVQIADPSCWSAELCSALGISATKLPRIIAPTDAAGSLAADAAADLGLPSGIPVVCGAGDTVASAFGAGLLEPGTILYSAGSTDCLSIVMSRPAGDPAWINVGYMKPERWLGIGANTSGGLSLEWIVREVFGHGGTGQALSEAEPAPSGRLVYLPYLQGERTPLWDADARGMFLGLTAATTRGEMARAVLEGAAFSARHMLESLERMLGGRVQSLRAVGGGMRSSVWNRIRADVLGRPLEVLRFQETAARGAAAMAGIGSGVYESAAAALEAIVDASASDRVDPDPERSAPYDRLYGIYREAYERTRGLMHELAR